MKFAAISWLWAIPGLLLVYLVFVFDEKRRTRAFAQFASPAVWTKIVPEHLSSRRLRKSKLWLLAWAFLFLAAARPQWGKHEETIKLSGLDIVFALDLSRSMEVEDVVPNRLKKAKHWIRTFAERLKGDRLGIVGFAASAYVACPLTNDMGYVGEVLDSLTPESIPNQGTDIGLGLQVALGALNRGAEEGAKKQSNAQSSRIVILITDGEDLEAQGLAQAKAIRETSSRLFVVGVGTEKGGPIPVRDESGQLHGYKKDGKGQPVVSAFSGKTLTSLAEAGGGKYLAATDYENEVDSVLQDLLGLNRSDYSERRLLIYEDRYQYPLAVAIVLLLIELALPLRVAKGAALVLLLLLLPPRAHASSLGSYLENEKGLKAFGQGKLDDAAKYFKQAGQAAPDDPTLKFNSGVAKLGQQSSKDSGEPKSDQDPSALDGAVKDFAEAAKGFESQKNAGMAGRSYFNQGQALAIKKDFKNAAQSYLNAMDSARLAQDEVLEKEARKNIELLAQEQENQKQQQKQKDQNQDKKDQDKQDQDKKDQADQNKDGKNTNQSFQAPKPKEFKSQKLSKEDADRVMAELSNRERELQGKLKKQKGKGQGSDRDW